MSTIQPSSELAETLKNVAQMSVDNYYNPYKTFEWPDSLPEAQWWMSRDLLSTHGTDLADSLSEDQLMALSKWESINFYSLNIHGIRELLLEVTKRIHSPGYELTSGYFHHFLGEENEHMWFFANFCLKYGLKIYPDKRIKLDEGAVEPDIETFLVFARILIFEDIVDYFNLRMGRDDSLHPLIRQVNYVHHQDESRHVTFGRQMVKHLHLQLREHYDSSRLEDLSNYLKRYMLASLESFYNPAAYRDAGIPEPYKFRNEVMRHPARKAYHKQYLKRTVTFLVKNNVISGGDFIS